MAELSEKDKIKVRLGLDRLLAHKFLFKHRHKQESPPFHKQMILDWHSSHPKVLDMVFRGGAKSTIAEEAIIIKALFREFKNGLIVGASFDRAAARLHAIKRELEGNDMIRELFGDLRGQPWGEDKIELSTGIVIQALGKGQSLRGIKELDQRPDLIFADDLEDRVDTQKPESRQKIKDWWDFDLVPACDPNHLERMAATPLHPECLPESLKRSPDWLVHTFPIYYLDEESKPQSSWPARFPIETVLKDEASAKKRGQIAGWRAEYMCQAEAPEAKPFKRDSMRVLPRVRSWQAVYSMTDPARTAKASSATTGQATWSWIGPKLVVWNAWAKRLMPNEIVDSLFDVYDRFHPVYIGVEEDGLNEFLMQPIRTEMVKRGISMPVKAMKAPRSKLDFIRGLQPYFQAGEVEFAETCTDLMDQLLSFPTGEIDAPNALAYALKMRPGAPIYDDFSAKHVSENLEPLKGHPVWLVLNATHTIVTAVLLQAINGSVRVYADYVREGDAVACVDDIVALAMLDAGDGVRCLGGPRHFDQYNNVGLAQALRRNRIELQRGAQPPVGRSHLTALLQREKQGVPLVVISDKARWVLNGFSGGYSRALNKQGQLADYADDNEYRVILEGLESFVGRLSAGDPDAQDANSNYAIASNGRRYMTTLPNQMVGGAELKR
jgi:hypothetical protein